MPAFLATSPRRWYSVSVSVASSCGVEPRGEKPACASLAFTSGIASTSTKASFSAFTTGAGSFAGSNEAFRIGVAIGDQVLDLRATGLIDTDDMNVLMNAGTNERQALRAAISGGLAEGSDKQAAWSKALLPQARAEMTVPCRIGDYTDFYTGIHHATTIGKLFRPDQPLMPNYKWVPIGYHGRASSIGVSGQVFKRPNGQTKAPDAAEPTFGPSKRLDYELELGFFIGRGNAQGEPIAIADAEEHLFGVTLLNDWSARDLQGWEYQPLGPFLSLIHI